MHPVFPCGIAMLYFQQPLIKQSLQCAVLLNAKPVPRIFPCKWNAWYN